MSAWSVTDSEVRSGSRLPGSDGRMTVAVWPLATAWDADAEALALELADEPELGVELEPPLEQAATETAAAERAATVVRTLLRTCSLQEGLISAPGGPAAVDVK
jgi:hypothetical protein